MQDFTYTYIYIYIYTVLTYRHSDWAADQFFEYSEVPVKPEEMLVSESVHKMKIAPSFSTVFLLSLNNVQCITGWRVRVGRF